MFDNGPQFIASEFVDFLKQNGVKQTLAAPYHPSSNGAAERTVQTLTEALQKEAERVRRDAPKRSLKHQLANCLFQYRNTPHSVTGVTPAELFLKCNPRTKFSVLKPNMEMHIQNQQGKLQQHDKSNAIQYSNKIKSLCLKLFNLDEKIIERDTHAVYSLFICQRLFFNACALKQVSL